MTRRKKIPSMLNTLTILTFIGSGFSLLGSIISLVSLPQMREKVKEGMKNAKMSGEQPADEADMLEVITEGVEGVTDETPTSEPSDAPEGENPETEADEDNGWGQWKYRWINFGTINEIIVKNEWYLTKWTKLN